MNETRYAIQIVADGAFSTDGKRVELHGKIDRRTALDVADAVQSSKNGQLRVDVLESHDEGVTWRAIE